MWYIFHAKPLISGFTLSAIVERLSTRLFKESVPHCLKYTSIRVFGAAKWYWNHVLKPAPILLTEEKVNW